MGIRNLYALVLSIPLLYGCNNIRFAGYTVDREAQIEIVELIDRVDINHNREIEPEEIKRVKRYIAIAERIEYLERKINNFINGISGLLQRREEDE